MGNTKSSVSNEKHQIYFIGNNKHGQFGLGHNKRIKKLTLCNNQLIKRVYVGNKYAIYGGIDHSNLWAAGWNIWGQCGVEIAKDDLCDFASIDYFSANKISIHQVYVNVVGGETYFISDNKQVYVCGRNFHETLRFDSDDGPQMDLHSDQQYEPKLVEELKYVTQIVAGGNFSIALCNELSKDLMVRIIRIWSSLEISDDIVQLILQYGKTSNVYWKSNITANKYNPIKIFTNKHIIKMESTLFCSYFVENNGTLWVYGHDRFKFGLLGFEYSDEQDVKNKIYVPQKIQYFADNNIKICDIACGKYHVLALDSAGKVHSFGHNKSGQCGHDVSIDGNERIQTPKVIKLENNVVKIRCGETNSYIKTGKSQNFLFGDNSFLQCLVFDKKITSVSVPHQIDQVVQKKLNNKYMIVIDAILGADNVTVICESIDMV